MISPPVMLSIDRLREVSEQTYKPICVRRAHKNCTKKMTEDTLDNVIGIPLYSQNIGAIQTITMKSKTLNKCLIKPAY